MAIAREYGVHAAIILKNLHFWIQKNEANGKHYHDGTYWTYNSVSAFEKIFPYLSTKQIRNAIKKLIENGLIVEGNFNDISFDRTKWYALTEKGKSVCLNEKLHLLKRANGSDEKGEPIPDSKPDSKPDGDTGAAPGTSETEDLKQFMETYNAVCTKLQQVQQVTGARRNAVRVFKSNFTFEQFTEICRRANESDFLTGKNSDRNWRANFDFLLRTKQAAKILEGDYDNREQEKKIPHW